MKYCNSLTAFSRFQTREVMVGNLGFGGNNPIRVQSMTTANTMDTLATVEESIRMIKAGCELVRITAPSKKEDILHQLLQTFTSLLMQQRLQLK